MECPSWTLDHSCLRLTELFGCCLPASAAAVAAQNNPARAWSPTWSWRIASGRCCCCCRCCCCRFCRCPNWSSCSPCWSRCCSEQERAGAACCRSNHWSSGDVAAVAAAASDAVAEGAWSVAGVAVGDRQPKDQWLSAPRLPRECWQPLRANSPMLTCSSLGREVGSIETEAAVKYSSEDFTFKLCHLSFHTVLLFSNSWHP